jgi:alpha,alpha-trehalose-phosphate synthase [UDP-forming]
VSQLVIVANRLPVQAPTAGAGWTRSPGGLAAALHPTLARQGGLWVGWPGGRRTTSLPTDLGYDLQAVDLTVNETRGFYDGMANSTLWPLYHDLVRQPVYRRDWWHDYHRVNERFADVIASSAEPGATVWVHDYQLQLVPAMLRERRPDVRIGFFLHIPFPASDVFARLPWREQILRGLGGADVIGLQTPRDAENLRRAAVRVGGKDSDLLARSRVTAVPISIDVDEWEEKARDPEIIERAAQLRAQLGDPGAVLLGIDRLDYTKGIEHRLAAFRELLSEGVLSVPDAVLVQVASPSRDRTLAYRNERARIEQTVGEINGTFGQVGAPAVHYIHRPVDPVDVAALYRVADVMLVTPIADGMNLVAKEFVASRIDDTGALVLSEFAGCAHELIDALQVNPHDIDGLKAAIRGALSLDDAEARRRMRAMRAVVSNQTVHDWAEQFLARLRISRADGARPTAVVTSDEIAVAAAAGAPTVARGA